MKIEKAPKPPIEIPPPIITPETPTPLDPEVPFVPDEDPDVIPEEDPLVKPPNEIPLPDESP
jgi:hypothetical protein